MGPVRHTTRRELIAGSAALLAAGYASRVLAPLEAAASALGSPAAAGFHAPADTVAHAQTWMAWPARRDVWGSLLGAARADIARIALTIAAYEPVSMVARPDQLAEAGRACGGGVQMVAIPNDDLWMRDMGPLFLLGPDGGVAGLDMNFNGWGNKQVHPNDRLVARRVLAHLGIERFRAPFVSEGGALEVDGEGTVMATESSIVNPNRNPRRSRDALGREILGALGASKMIWLKGLRGHDITDDHIDGLARFLSGGRVVVDLPAYTNEPGVWAASERAALHRLRGARDARGLRLQEIVCREPSTIPAGQNPLEFVAVYVNWYVCNGAVLLPAFGDVRADAAARELVGELFPGRTVEQLRIDAIAAGGGGIHCCTQQQPVI